MSVPLSKCRTGAGLTIGTHLGTAVVAAKDNNVVSRHFFNLEEGKTSRTGRNGGKEAESITPS